jgi:hypothetical protein
MKKLIYLAVAASFPLLAFDSKAQILQVTNEKTINARAAETSEEPQAIVLSVKGACSYSPDGITFSDLKAGQVCKQGAVLKTAKKSRTDIFFRRIGTTVRLQPDTELLLEKMSRKTKDGALLFDTLLDLRAGRIFTVVRALIPGSTLEIRNAAGRSVVEGGEGEGRYIITADGAQVASKNSAIPLKMIGQSGITVIKPGQKFNAKEGKAFSLETPSNVEELISLDEIQSLAEELTPPESEPLKKD